MFLGKIFDKKELAKKKPLKERFLETFYEYFRFLLTSK